MIIAMDKEIVNTMTFPKNNVSQNSENPYLFGFGDDSATISKKYKDLYFHYLIPVSRQRNQLSNNWVQQAHSLFPGIRAFTEEEVEIHKKGLMKLFKPTGRNLHNL